MFLDRKRVYYTNSSYARQFDTVLPNLHDFDDLSSRFVILFPHLRPTMAFQVARYLAPFHPKRVPHHFTDVLIIGGGLAGLRAAIAIPPDLKAVVISKQSLQQSNSNYAQGGIASVQDPQDRYENHVADTLEAGRGLCDREVVEAIVRDAPKRIDELISWGVVFDRDGSQLALGREGGHSHSRIVHALGDATGREVMRGVIAKAAQKENVDTWPDTFTIDLLTHERTCRGALVWNPSHGKTLIWAKQTILCTGGAGQVYRETTNPPVATGDGHAMAYRAGVELRDMEFMQFHPTVLYIAGSSRNLITEAIRGHGAHLIDTFGKRFMFEYDERGELAPRDVVSRSIVAQMEKTRHPNVYLSLEHLSEAETKAKFPGIAAICSNFGLDIAKDWIPVRPGAHYMIGGLTVDMDGRTSLPNLWAAGEVTSSGLHGANRLASNSLLEGLVMGAKCGEMASAAATGVNDDYRPLPLENTALPESNEAELDLADIRNSLKSQMWRSVGVERAERGLCDTRDMIDRLASYVLKRQFARPEGWELQNMLLVSYLITMSALARQESRGVHQRTDFPETDDRHWKKHLKFEGRG